MEETDVHGMEWPAQSTDLYIIENVWHQIKHELRKHVQNITSRQLFETAIRNIWTEIPIDYIQAIYKSTSKRLKQVIKAKECIKKVLGK